MILNGQRYTENPHANYIQGVNITLSQVSALEAWKTWEIAFKYPPLAVELATVINTTPNVVRRWMQGWADAGIIKRGKGLREYSITEKGDQLIIDLRLLESYWKHYTETRDKIVRDYPKITASG